MKEYIANNKSRSAQGVLADMAILGKIFLQSMSKTNRAAIVDMLGQNYPQLQDIRQIENVQMLWGMQIAEMFEEDRIKDAFVEQLGAKCGMELGTNNEEEIMGYLKGKIMGPLVEGYTELYLTQGTNHHSDYYFYLVMNHLAQPQNSIQDTIELLKEDPLFIIRTLEKELASLPEDQQPEVLNWMKDKAHGVESKSSKKI